MTSSFNCPAVPLPSSAATRADERVSQPTKDSNDLFESLFTTEETIFQSQQLRKESREISSSFGSDFGAFVSVPASEETKEHPLLDFSDEFPSSNEVKPKVSDFFHQIAEEAKKNNERNEQRVVNKILKYEQDPVLWLDSSDRRTSPIPFRNRQQSPPSQSTTDPRSNMVSQSPLDHVHIRESPNAQKYDHLNDFSAATLPRRWMSNLLNASASSLPYTLKHEPSKTLPNHKTISPPVTHTSPFAPHSFAPPSGAPGFSGDYSWNQGGFEFDEGDRHLHRLKLEGRRESTSPVLKLELAEQIRASLPPLPRLGKSWNLLYSLDQHGVSLQTLYTRCASKVSSTLVVIQDSEDCLFGVWLAGTVHLSSGYYGTGDSFLWRSQGQGKIQVFKWTGKNDYVALCEKDFISFGGGTGKYGLYLNENLTDGSSAPCPTFDNPVLSGSGTRDGRDMTVGFECVGVEIWGLDN